MSGRKNVLIPYTILSAGNMSGNLVSSVTNIQYQDNIGLQLVWSGASPTGTIQAQVSLDQSTWIPITGASVSTGGSAGNAYLDLNQLSAPYIRIIFTASMGSVGSLTVVIGAKML